MQGQISGTDGQRYELVGEIGRGGFGTVYRAKMRGSGGFEKTVALKVLNPEVAAEPGFAERLRDEARILGLLQHRAIVRVDDLIQLDGAWTVVMELVGGTDLKRIVGAGPVPVGPALEIIEEVASALGSAFSARGSTGNPVHLIHRDIKPSNIHLTAAGEVKVLDFGVARAEFQQRESVTRSLFFGSIGYMAPERLDGIDCHAGDVYSLGSVLVELITGEPTGRTSAHPERHETIRTAALHKLWTACPDEGLYELAARCLAYLPDARPSARDLARDVRQLRARHREPWLRDWAENTVPPLMIAPTLAVPSGASHASAAEPLPPVDPAAVVEDMPASGSLVRPSGRSPSAVLAVSVAIGFAMVLMVSAAAVGIVIQLRSDSTTATAPPAPTRGAQALVDDDDVDILADVEEAPVDVVQPKPAASQKPPRTPTRTTAPARQPEPEPEAQPAEPAPPPETKPTGRVQVTGDVASIQLVGQDGTFGPGSVPAGNYRILARFGDSDTPVQAGTVVVKSGGVVTLSCRGGLRRCTVR